MIPQSTNITIRLPLFQTKVPAGFPSPADDHIESRLEPNEFLIDQPDSTFFVRVVGVSMIDVGLMPGDVVVVNKGMHPKLGQIVLATVDGEFTIKILGKQKDGSAVLIPANQQGSDEPITIKESMSFEIWGVVTGSMRRFK